MSKASNGRAGHIDWPSIDVLPPTAGTETLTRRAFSGIHMTALHVMHPKGAVAPFHNHENEQITVVFSGRLLFRIANDDGETEFEVASGESVYVPSNVWHGVTAVEDTIQMDVFSPVRLNFSSTPTD